MKHYIEMDTDVLVFWGRVSIYLYSMTNELYTLNFKQKKRSCFFFCVCVLCWNLFLIRVFVWVFFLRIFGCMLKLKSLRKKELKKRKIKIKKKTETWNGFQCDQKSTQLSIFWKIKMKLVKVLEPAQQICELIRHFGWL